MVAQILACLLKIGWEMCYGEREEIRFYDVLCTVIELYHASLNPYTYFTQICCILDGTALIFVRHYICVFCVYYRYRGGSGPLHVSRGKTNHPLHKAFIEAGQQAGYPFTDDMNGYQQEGVGWMDMTVYKGARKEDLL